MAKASMSRGEIAALLDRKFRGLALDDPSSIRPDIWRVPRRAPEDPNWDVSFTGVAGDDMRAVEATADLVRRQVDLA